MRRQRKEQRFRVINLEQEYGRTMNGCKYAIASPLPEEILKKRYMFNLWRYCPFIYLTEEMGNVISESRNNDDKYRKREEKNGIPFGYEDSDTELHHLEVTRQNRMCRDPLEILIEQEALQNGETESQLLEEALLHLSEMQKRRVKMLFYDGLTQQEIAEAEGVSQPAVKLSLNIAMKDLRERMVRA